MEMPHTSQSEFKDETEPGISIYQTGENGWDVSVWAITMDDTELPNTPRILLVHCR